MASKTASWKRRLKPYQLVLLSIAFFALKLLVLRYFLSFFSSGNVDPYVKRHLRIQVCNKRLYPASDTLLEDRVTILVNGFSEARIPILRRNMFHISQSLVVDSIYVLWSNTSTPPEILSGEWVSGGAPIVIVRQKTTSLNDRFLPRRFINTQVVVVCDDDITLDDRSLTFALKVWQSHKERIVGFFPRGHEFINGAKKWQYRKFPDKYSIMLTKFMLIHTDYLYSYTCEAPRGVKEFVDEKMNCEDIAMNFLVSSMTKMGPVLVEGTPRDWGDTRNSEMNLSSIGLSAREDHRRDRGECIAAFKELWGGIELRYSYGKVTQDSSEQVLCDKFGVMVHCDSKASDPLEARRALGLNIVKSEERFAYVTLIGSAEYIPAACVLSQTLKLSGTIHDILLMLDDYGDLNAEDPLLTAHFHRVIKVRAIGNPYGVKGFNKLNAWLLEEYAKVVYIDVDTMVLTNLDHLFDHPEPSAAPDVYMSEKFNSGVLVLKPSTQTYTDMLSLVNVLPSYNRGDQGFLNSYFSGWFQMPPPHRLPARYNAVFLFPDNYHPPNWFERNKVYEALGPLAVVHFAGPWFKPWRMNSTTTTGIVWCDIWLEISKKLKANDWKPLPLSGSQSIDLLSLVPNKGDYASFPKATLSPSPFLRGKDVPHQQFVPPPASGGREGFVTLLLDDNIFTVAVWATSYLQYHPYSAFRKTLLLVSSRLSHDTWLPLVHLFNFVRVVEPIKLRGKYLPPEFMVLHVWNQRKYFDRVVYVNPLAMFVENVNDLFRYNAFAAVPSVFPADMFSSSVMLVQTNSDLFHDLLRKLGMLHFPRNSLDRYLNAYFFDWFSRSPHHRIPNPYGVDIWFKEGLMKYFLPWKIIVFDKRAPPWTDISEWLARDRLRVVKLWRRTFCSLEEELKPIKLDTICGEADL